MGTGGAAFWRHYLRIGGCERSGLDPADAVCVEVLVQAGMGLRVDISRSESTCYLIHPALESPRQLGWDDDAHWHPHVFMWDEVVLLNQAATSSPPGFPPVLLLLPFTAAPGSELTPAAVSIVASGLSATGDFPGSVLEEIARDVLSLYMSVPVIWQEHPGLGPVPAEREAAGGGWLYSLRHPENPGFPFAELASLMAAARRSSHS